MNRYSPIIFDGIKDISFTGVHRIRVEGHRMELDIGFREVIGTFSFEHIFAYKSIKESFGLKTMAWRDRTSEIGQCNYRVEESEFLAWARAADPALGPDIQHYEFFTDSDLIGVLATAPPAASFWSADDEDDGTVRAPLDGVFPDGEVIGLAGVPPAREQFRPDQPMDLARPVRLLEWNATVPTIEYTGTEGIAYFARLRLRDAAYMLLTEPRFFRHRVGTVGPDLAPKLPAGQRYAFYQVESSSLVEWVRDQSYGLLDDDKLAHFICVAENGVIDIVDDRFPATVLA